MTAEEIIEEVNKLRTPENIALLKKLPKSKLRYTVRAVNSTPTGDRNMRDHCIDPYYEVYEKPVDQSGEKNDFFGTKRKWIGAYKSREVAEAIAWRRNFWFHENFCRTGKRW